MFVRKAAFGCVLALAVAAAHAQGPGPVTAPVDTAGPAAVVAPPPAPAAQPPVLMPASPMSAATAAEIQKINENMTLLQAQLNQLELKAKIAAKQREVNAQGGGDAMSSFASKNGNPSVVSVAGLKGHLEAVLVFPGGVTQRVKAGDQIDDRRVAKVGVNEVVLTDLKGKNVQRLAFGSAPTMREATPATQAVGTMPPMPAGMPPVMR